MANGIRLRAGRRSYSTQIAVPLDLVGRVKGPSGKPVKVLEESLHTLDRREALTRRWKKRAEIADMFQSIRDGLPLADADLKQIAEEEMRRAYDLIAAHFWETHEKLGEIRDANAIEQVVVGLGGYPSTGPNWLLKGLQTTDYAKSRLLRLGRTPTVHAVAALGEAILVAQSAAIDAVVKGLPVPPLPGRVYQARSLAPGTAPRVTDLAERYLADRRDLAKKTTMQARNSFRLFADFADDPHFDAVDRQTVGAWVSKLAGSLQPATVNRHLSTISKAWKWCLIKGLINEGIASPFTLHWLPVSIDSGWLPFEPKELNLLVQPSPIQLHILTALFSGMRDSEIVRAKLVKEDGVLCFQVEQGKTPSARRKIPVHKKLIELGIVGQRQSLQKFSASIVSKRFTRWRRSLGIERDRVSFHSLRKNFVEALERAGVSSDTVALLVGHSSKRSFTFVTYSPHGPGLKMLKEAVAKVKYSRVKLPAATHGSK